MNYIIDHFLKKLADFFEHHLTSTPPPPHVCVDSYLHIWHIFSVDNKKDKRLKVMKRIKLGVVIINLKKKRQFFESFDKMI